jgi:hypothetical protein
VCNASEFGCTADATVEARAGALRRFCDGGGARARQAFAQSGALRLTLTAAASAHDTVAAAALNVLAVILATSDGQQLVLAEQRRRAPRSGDKDRGAGSGRDGVAAHEAAQPLGALVEQLAGYGAAPVVQEAALQVTLALLRCPAAHDGGGVTAMLRLPVVTRVALAALTHRSHPVASAAVPVVAALVVRRRDTQDDDESDDGRIPAAKRARASHTAPRAGVPAPPAPAQGSCRLWEAVAAALQRLAAGSSEHHARALEVAGAVAADPHEGWRFLRQHQIPAHVLATLVTCTSPRVRCAGPVV